mmetsp:Transcript_26537/g.87163  ORF Transcript_26537/g.87163 Transcript_26537/m.87163 type:complete len:261 (-) Transcript_26537:293-1075(-)
MHPTTDTLCRTTSFLETAVLAPDGEKSSGRSIWPTRKKEMRTSTSETNFTQKIIDTDTPEKSRSRRYRVLLLPHSVRNELRRIGGSASQGATTMSPQKSFRTWDAHRVLFCQRNRSCERKGMSSYALPRENSFLSRNPVSALSARSSCESKLCCDVVAPSLSCCSFPRYRHTPTTPSPKRQARRAAMEAIIAALGSAGMVLPLLSTAAHRGATASKSITSHASRGRLRRTPANSTRRKKHRDALKHATPETFMYSEASSA